MMNVDDFVPNLPAPGQRMQFDFVKSPYHVKSPYLPIPDHLDQVYEDRLTELDLLRSAAAKEEQQEKKGRWLDIISTILSAISLFMGLKEPEPRPPVINYGTVLVVNGQMRDVYHGHREELRQRPNDLEAIRVSTIESLSSIKNSDNAEHHDYIDSEIEVFSQLSNPEQGVSASKH